MLLLEDVLGKESLISTKETEINNYISILNRFGINSKAEKMYYAKLAAEDNEIVRWLNKARYLKYLLDTGQIM